MGKDRARARQGFERRQAAPRGPRDRQAVRLRQQDRDEGRDHRLRPRLGSQPLHVDEEAAKLTLVGGLCASGWHTCMMMMRLVADGMLNRTASLGAPSVDE